MALINHYTGETIQYRDYTIEGFLTGFLVYYCGDNVFFNTIEAAKQFIDEMIKQDENER